MSTRTMMTFVTLPEWIRWGSTPLWFHAWSRCVLWVLVLVVTSLQVKMKGGVIEQWVLHFHFPGLERERYFQTPWHYRRLQTVAQWMTYSIIPSITPAGVMIYDGDMIYDVIRHIQNYLYKHIALTGASPGHSYTVKSPSSFSSSEVAPDSGILESFRCLHNNKTQKACHWVLNNNVNNVNAWVSLVENRLLYLTW